ncbi:DUF86 domain-containing protein [Candidatus Woesearchaeota archaeon]|nr:DUF86 domain-containing protein [Candidatus Woesearchaeota archaeon]
MMNQERILAIVKDIDRFFGDLECIQVKNVDDLKDKKEFYATSMILFSIINRAIDLGEEIVADKKIGLPTTYKDIFYLLEKNRIINKQLFEQLSSLIYFRNLAAHEYHTFTEKDVFTALKNVNAIKRFVDIVKKIMSRQQK